MRRAAVLLVCTACAAVLASTARADGDPASDYLLSSQVFLPFDVKVTETQQQELLSTFAAANKAGYRIRVAIIATPYDLGSVTPLWRKPRTYAKFLGVEIGFVYRGRLLIVMPNGFGYSWQKRPTEREYAVLSKIPVGKGGAGLVEAATTAVVKLAAANGIEVKATSPASHDNQSRDRIVIIVASVALIALAVLVRLALRRRSKRT
jgi:hypothetical protein